MEKIEERVDVLEIKSDKMQKHIHEIDVKVNNIPLQIENANIKQLSEIEKMIIADKNKNSQETIDRRDKEIDELKNTLEKRNNKDFKWRFWLITSIASPIILLVMGFILYSASSPSNYNVALQRLEDKIQEIEKGGVKDDNN